MIFLISHHPENREQLVRFFDQHGYEICLAPHRENVLDAIRQSRPHVIVLDAYLSSPSPLDILRRVRADGYTGKVILLAGPSSHSLLPEFYRLGVDQVVGGAQFSEDAINVEQLESSICTVVRPLIEARAREIFIARGGKEGSAQEDWLQAEREILLKKTRGDERTSSGGQT